MGKVCCAPGYSLLLEPINLFIHITGKVVSVCHMGVLSVTLEVVFVHIFICALLVLTPVCCVLCVCVCSQVSEL